MKRTLVVGFLAVAMVLSTSAKSWGATTPAGAKAAEKTTSEKPKAKSKPFQGKIKSVDLKTKVFVLEGPKCQTFLVTSESRINKDDKPVSLNELSVGEAVTGYALQTPDGQWEARSVYAGKRAAKQKN